jgi:hypothetical protein
VASAIGDAERFEKLGVTREEDWVVAAAVTAFGKAGTSEHRGRPRDCAYHAAAW